jgi:hypothetical protein
MTDGLGWVDGRVLGGVLLNTLCIFYGHVFGTLNVTILELVFGCK